MANIGDYYKWLNREFPRKGFRQASSKKSNNSKRRKANKVARKRRKGKTSFSWGDKIPRREFKISKDRIFRRCFQGRRFVYRILWRRVLFRRIFLQRGSY